MRLLKAASSLFINKIEYTSWKKIFFYCGGETRIAINWIFVKLDGKA
jgi:hypothetical protein